MGSLASRLLLSADHPRAEVHARVLAPSGSRVPAQPCEEPPRLAVVHLIVVPVATAAATASASAAAASAAAASASASALAARREGLGLPD